LRLPWATARVAPTPKHYLKVYSSLLERKLVGLPCPAFPPPKRGELEGGGGMGAASAGFDNLLAP